MDIQVHDESMILQKQWWPDYGTGAVLLATLLKEEFFEQLIDLDTPICVIVEQRGGEITAHQYQLLSAETEDGQPMDLAEAYNNGFKQFYMERKVCDRVVATILMGISTVQEQFIDSETGEETVEAYQAMVQHVQAKDGTTQLRISRFEYDPDGMIEEMGYGRTLDKADGVEIVDGSNILFTVNR